MTQLRIAAIERHVRLTSFRKSSGLMSEAQEAPGGRPSTVAAIAEAPATVGFVVALFGLPFGGVECFMVYPLTSASAWSA